MREIDYDEVTLLNFKNLVLVSSLFVTLQAPFFEEFIYRAVLINIFLEAGVMSFNKCVLVLPLFFATGTAAAL